MLSSQHSLDLRKEKDFFSTCKRKHTLYFSFFYKKNDKSGLKISIIVPKKIIRLATKRNQIKRRIHFYIEKILRKSKKSLKILEKNINLVIIINNPKHRNIYEEKNNIDLEKIIESSLIEISV